MAKSYVIYRDNKGNKVKETWEGGKKVSSETISRTTSNKTGSASSSTTLLKQQYVQDQQAKADALQKEQLLAENQPPPAETVPRSKTGDGSKEYYYQELSPEGTVSSNIFVESGRLGGSYGRSALVETSTYVPQIVKEKVERGDVSIIPSKEDVPPEILSSYRIAFEKDPNVQSINYKGYKVTRDDVFSTPDQYGGITYGKSDKKLNVISNFKGELFEGVGSGFGFKTAGGGVYDFGTRSKTYQAGYIGGSVLGLWAIGERGGVSTGKKVANFVYKYPRVYKTVSTVGKLSQRSGLGYGLQTVYYGSRGYQAGKAIYNKDYNELARVGFVTTRDVSFFKGFGKGFSEQTRANLEQNYYLYKPDKIVPSVQKKTKTGITVLSKSKGTLYEFNKYGKVFSETKASQNLVFKGSGKPILTESGVPSGTVQYSGVIKSRTYTYSKVLRKDVSLYNMRTQYVKSPAIRQTNNVQFLAGQKNTPLVKGYDRVGFGVGRSNIDYTLDNFKTGSTKSAYYYITLDNKLTNVKGKFISFGQVRRPNDLIVKGTFKEAGFNMENFKGSTSGGNSNVNLKSVSDLKQSLSKTFIVPDKLVSKPINIKGSPLFLSSGSKADVKKTDLPSQDKPVSRSVPRIDSKVSTITPKYDNPKPEINTKSKVKPALIVQSKSKSKTQTDTKSKEKTLGMIASPASISRTKSLIREDLSLGLKLESAGKLKLDQRQDQRSRQSQRQDQRSRQRTSSITKTSSFFPVSFFQTGTPPPPPVKIGFPRINLPDLPKPSRKKKGSKIKSNIKFDSGYSSSLEANIFNVKQSKDEDLFRSGLTIRPLRRL